MDKEQDILVGFDAKRIVSNGTGLGNYGRTLVNNLQAYGDARISYRLYAPTSGKPSLLRQINENDRTQYVFSQKKSNVGRALWRSSGIVSDLKRDGIDIYHGLTGELPRGLRNAGIKGIVTIHDLIFLRYPEYYNWIDVQIYRYKFQLACREAERIIAISECTKRDIMEYGHVSADKIDVIYQDCDNAFKQKVSSEKLHEVSVRYQLPNQYILSVGSIEARKNVLLAVKALEGLPDDVHLVIVGKHTAYTDEVLNYISAHYLERRVMMLHNVPFADLPAIYQLAQAFVYPSRYEGFGIPIIEAIHSGLPIVACAGSCLEEAGGPDGLYVDPDDVEGMRAALVDALDNTKRDIRVARCREYVRRFEAETTTPQMIGEYFNVL